MQKVPKIVLRQLREQAGEPHPEADLLTAFVEQSLTASERAEVLEHLARCGDCRQVVMLALPAVEAGSLPTVVSPARGQWLGWPGFRWGLVAAGVVLVASVGVLQYRQRHQPNPALVAKVASPERTLESTLQATPLSPAASPPAVPVPGPTAQSDLRRKSAPIAGGAIPMPVSAAPSSPAAGAVSSQPVLHKNPTGSGGGFAPAFNAFKPRVAQSASAAPSQQPPAPLSPDGAAADRAEGGSEPSAQPQADAAQIKTTPGDTRDRLAENQSDHPSQARSLAKSNAVGKAKNAVGGTIGGPVASSAPPAFAPAAVPLQTSPALLLRTSPRWSINAAGALQRSFDAGGTWEIINVDSVSLVTSSQTQAVVVENGVKNADNQKEENRNADNQNEDKKSLKQTAQLNSTPVFRAVAAIGPEVWAGGSAAMLYHSADFGAHWSRVLPAAAGALLTGDIIAIEFPDSQHGKITTSTAEVWITPDAGHTWLQQPQ